jgi:hypothetical protein
MQIIQPGTFVLKNLPGVRDSVSAVAPKPAKNDPFSAAGTTIRAFVGGARRLQVWCCVMNPASDFLNVVARGGCNRKREVFRDRILISPVDYAAYLEPHLRGGREELLVPRPHWLRTSGFESTKE